MKHFTNAAAALLFATYAAADAEVDKRDLCSEGSSNVGGNFYCQAVKAITYTGIGHSGNYSQITNMPTSGGCTSQTKAYSGNLAPFDEEVSLHFRGPLKLKQFAVYTPSKGKARRDSTIERRHRHAEMHAHNAAHRREAEPEAVAEPVAEPALGDKVVATINGKLATWLNDYSGEPTPAPAANNHGPPAAASAAPAATSASSNNNNNGGGQGLGSGSGNSNSNSQPSSDSSSSSSSGSSYGSSSSNAAWTRQGYYNSEKGTSQGLVFLNHHGGSGSGTFDYTYGNSLSYASSDGTAGASSPQTLKDTTIPSTAEVIIFTDNKCSDTDCGYVRPKTTAYHGFAGAEKVFLLEFSMPDSGETGGNQWSPINMPAIWMLNAQIPRTLQYGDASCSCWTSGCGEFDIFEVLAPGDTRCKSTIHGNNRGGDSDYFTRPTTGTLKAAVVLNDNHFHIKVLDGSTSFDASLDASFVSGIASSTSTNSKNSLVSLFGLS